MTKTTPLTHTSWKLIRSHEFFEKFVSTRYFVQVHGVICKPELQCATFLKQISQ